MKFFNENLYFFYVSWFNKLPGFIFVKKRWRERSYVCASANEQKHNGQ